MTKVGQGEIHDPAFQLVWQPCDSSLLQGSMKVEVHNKRDVTTPMPDDMGGDEPATPAER